MQLKTNEGHYATANKRRTLSKCKTDDANFANIKNVAHYANGNKLIKICNCRQMKPTIQLHTNEAYYATATNEAHLQLKTNKINNATANK